jgi:hypothetical protein
MTGKKTKIEFIPPTEEMKQYLETCYNSSKAFRFSVLEKTLLGEDIEKEERAFLELSTAYVYLCRTFILGEDVSGEETS